VSPAPTGSDAGAAPLPLLEQAQALWRELPGLVSDRVELLVLELKRAGGALARMLVMGVAAILLAMTAWGLFWALVVSLLVQSGLALWGALFIALVVNAAAAAGLAWRLKALLPRLDLPATRRHLQFTPSPLPSTTPPPHNDRAPIKPPAGASHDPQPAH